MGILKVGVGALKSVLEDSWREYFYCPAMDPDPREERKVERRKCGNDRDPRTPRRTWRET